MKDILSKLLIFAAGAGIGSAVTWKFVKTKYERITQEEIDNVKEYYRKKNGENEAADESESVEVENNDKNVSPYERDVICYNSIIQSEGYSEVTESGEEVADTDGPYVIDADEFGDSHEYDTDSLVYYADGVLATEADEVVDDANYIVGMNNLTKLTESGEDEIFVRNDRTKCDYEVTRESRTFAEVVGIDPPENE